MSAPTCSMAGLVEARRDGRLGPRDSASVERHLASCARCSRLAADLEAIARLARRPGERPSPLEHQRGRVRLLREAALPAPAPARSPLRAATAGLVVALAALAIVLALPAGRTVPVLARLPAVRMVSPPEQPEAPPRGEARTETTVRSIDDARFVRTTEGTVERVLLESGTVEASVRPLMQGERFVVQTDDAEVEVRGTIFRVEARDRRIRRVAVTEGVVRVTHGGRTWELRAGDTWNVPVRSEREVQPAPPPPIAPEPAPPEEKTPKAPPPPPHPRDEASKAFSDGVDLVERGEYGDAVKALETFRARHPDDPRAEDAAFLRIVAFQRAHRPGAAAAAARSYLADYPRGARRAEAEAIARAAEKR